MASPTENAQVESKNNLGRLERSGHESSLSTSKQSFIEALFKFYKIIFSPILLILGGSSGACRYHPTCSQYAKEAFLKYSSFIAFYLVIKRVVLCNPWVRRDVYDPLPMHICKGLRKETLS